MSDTPASPSYSLFNLTGDDGDHFLVIAAQTRILTHAQTLALTAGNQALQQFTVRRCCKLFTRLFGICRFVLLFESGLGV